MIQLRDRFFDQCTQKLDDDVRFQSFDDVAPFNDVSFDCCAKYGSVAIADNRLRLETSGSQQIFLFFLLHST